MRHLVNQAWGHAWKSHAAAFGRAFLPGHDEKAGASQARPGLLSLRVAATRHDLRNPKSSAAASRARSKWSWRSPFGCKGFVQSAGETAIRSD